MKKILFIISFLIGAIISFAQAPVPRSSSAVTAVDSRIRAALTFGIPITNDTTLNGGLDSLGSMIYSKLHQTVYVRDTNMIGGGHKWTNMLFGQGIQSLNGLTGSSQTFAIGTSGFSPNISSVGTVHTFNFPLADQTHTGVLGSSDYTTFFNKLNKSDTAAMLAGYVQNISIGLPSNTFSTPSFFSVSSHAASGTISFINQSNNTFLAGPSSGGVGPVTWRGLVNGDLPLSSVTPGSYTNSNITVNQQGIITSISNGSGSGGGSGTVTFVGMTVPAAFSVSPSSITTSGTFAISAVGNSGQYVNGAGGLTVFPNIPAQFNPIQGSGMLITGTYPNITFTVTGSGGTVTTFSSGNLSPLFTTSVATATTTPAQSFTLSTQSPFTIFGNNTAGTAAPTFFAPSLTGALFQNEGTTTTLLHGNAAGNLSFSAVSLVNDVTGNLGVSHLNSGTGASASTFWRGDGTWSTPSGGGTVTSVGILSTDFFVSGSPITGSGNITLNINTNAVTYAKFQQVAASSLVGNPTGSLANAQGITLGYGLKFVGTTLAFDSASVKDTIFAVNGLTTLGSTKDSIGLGGRLYQNTIVSGANAYAFTLDSFQAASGRGFRVNFGSDAPWDMAVRDSVTGFWTRVAKGTPGQSWQMLSGGGVGWANQAGGITNPMTTLGDMIVGGSSGTPVRFPVAPHAGMRIVSIASGIGVQWGDSVSRDSSWNVRGNAGLSNSTFFLGTTDNHPLFFRVNNTVAAYIDSNGGSGNVFFGYSSANHYNQGQDNTGIGFGVLKSINGSAVYNTGVGYNALANNTSGQTNSALGMQALYANTSGGNNVAVGYTSLGANTSGSRNTALGLAALFSNTTGNNNTAVGLNALANSIVISNNTAVGSYALLKDSLGGRNIGIGDSALYLMTNLTNVIGIGSSISSANGVSNTTIIGNDISFTTSNAIVLGKSTQHAIIGAAISGQTDDGNALQVYGNGIQTWYFDATHLTTLQTTSAGYTSLVSSNGRYLINKTTDNGSGAVQIQSSTFAGDQLALEYDNGHLATLGANPNGDLNINATNNITIQRPVILSSSFSVPFVTSAINYSVIATDVIVEFTAAATCTLPSSTGNAGRILYIKNRSAGNITLSGMATGEFNLMAPAGTTGACVTLYSDGTGGGWKVISMGV